MWSLRPETVKPSWQLGISCLGRELRATVGRCAAQSLDGPFFPASVMPDRTSTKFPTPLALLQIDQAEASGNARRSTPYRA